MPRARYELTIEEAAAAFPNQGRGCLTAYVLPPLAVLVIGTLLAVFALTVTPVEAYPVTISPRLVALAERLDRMGH